MTPDVRVLHASDVHVDNGPDGTAGIIRLCDAAVRLDIDLLVLVGDSFDDNRPNDDARSEFAEQLARVPVPVVVLPGNHDPLVPGCVYDRMELAGHVTVLRTAGGETLRFDALGLELWGSPHVSWNDYSPMAGIPPRGALAWQIALAHGHLVRGPEDHHRAYLIRREELAASNRDYVALGHWDVQHEVMRGEVTAWYSGSPRRHLSSALVTLSTTAGQKSVDVEPLRLPA